MPVKVPGFAGQLKPHQVTAVRHLNSTDRTLLVMGTGRGKTIVALARIGAAFATSELVRGRDLVLYVTDASVVDQTAREAARFLPHLEIVSDRKPPFSSTAGARAMVDYRSAHPAGPDVMVISHESAAKKAGNWVRAFHSQIGLVVLDEVHKLKDHTGKTHKSVHELTKVSPRVYAMTATPYSNHPLETFALLSLIGAPDLPSRRTFERKFVLFETKTFETKWGVQEKTLPVGIKPEGRTELRDLFRRNAYIDRSVVAGLPARVGESIRWVTLSAAQEKAYRDARKKGGGSSYVLGSQSARVADGESALVDACIDLLQGPYATQKAIVYCESLAALSLLDERLTELAIGFRLVDGGVSIADRDVNLAAFRDDPEVRVLVGSKVLELGLNLQNARVLISLDASDNPQRERQREGRICRLGAPHDTYEHITLMPETYDGRRKVQRLERKAADADFLLDMDVPA